MYARFWVLDVSKPLNISPQQVLQWIVARTHFKWEEMRVAPRPPLSLGFSWSGDEQGAFSFDEIFEDDSDQGSEASNSD
jgi:hypothetical protein